MIRVKVDDFEMDLDDVRQNWLAEQLSERGAQKESVCVRVRIDEPGVKMNLTSGGCAGSSVGGRPPNDKERAIIELWNDRRLDEEMIHPGWLWTFLKRLREML